MRAQWVCSKAGNKSNDDDDDHQNSAIRGVARSLCLYQLITSTRKQWGELKDVCCTVGTDYSPLPLVRQQDTPLRALPGSSQCSSCAAAHEDRLPLHPPASQRLLQHMVWGQLVSSWILMFCYWTAQGHLRTNHTFKILLHQFETPLQTLLQRQ